MAQIGARKPPPPATFEARKQALDAYILNARAALVPGREGSALAVPPVQQEGGERD